MTKYWRVLLRSTTLPTLRSAWLSEKEARKYASDCTRMWHGSVWLQRDDHEENEGISYEEQIA